MIFLSFIYYFFHSLPCSLRYDVRLNANKLYNTNDQSNEIKRNDSSNSLDQPFIPLKPTLFSNKILSVYSGFDERFPLRTDFFLEFNNYWNETQNNITYKIDPTQYRELLKFKLFLIKYEFLKFLLNPDISSNKKVKLIDKYYQKNTIYHQSLKNGDLYKDLEF